MSVAGGGSGCSRVGGGSVAGWEGVIVTGCGGDLHVLQALEAVVVCYFTQTLLERGDRLLRLACTKHKLDTIMQIV